MSNVQIQLLDKLINQFSEEEKNIIDTNRFVYVYTKAWLYIKHGPDKYREDDAFDQPPIDYTKDELKILENGCRQLLEGVGMTCIKPFTGLNVMGFNDLFRLFHFENVQRKCKHGFVFNDKRGALDCITFQHIVDGSQVVYYNFCEYTANN
jgi:hypothetical protein